MRKSLPSIIGFILLIVGFLSLLLMGLGLRLTYLAFIDNLGALPGLLIRISMIMLGVIILYVSRTTTYENKKGLE